MKNLRILFVVMIVTLVVSCDEPASKGVTAGTIRYPSIILDGDGLVYVQEGATYDDAGAQAFLGEDDITDQLETDSDVDMDEPGVYTVSYSATIINELEQEATATAQRIIVVAPSNPNTTVDLTGTYLRDAAGTANDGAPAVWTKVAEGVYRNNNIGGVMPPSVAALPVYVFHFDDNTVTCPVQPVPNGYGTLSATMTLTVDGYSLRVANPFFGTGLRVFEKQ